MRAAATTGSRVPMFATGLGAVAVTVAAMLVITLASTTSAGLLGDLNIYRGAVSTVLSGGDLYGYTYTHLTVHGLGFTYPPFAALVLVPFALVGSGHPAERHARIAAPAGRCTRRSQRR